MPNGRSDAKWQPPFRHRNTRKCHNIHTRGSWLLQEHVLLIQREKKACFIHSFIIISWCYHFPLMTLWGIYRTLKIGKFYIALFLSEMWNIHKADHMRCLKNILRDQPTNRILLINFRAIASSGVSPFTCASISSSTHLVTNTRCRCLWLLWELTLGKSFFLKYHVWKFFLNFCINIKHLDIACL